MEFVWKPFYSHLGKSTELFTSAMLAHYEPPISEVNFEFTTLVDNPELMTYNVFRIADKFYEYIHTKFKHAYKTNHIMINMGGDFYYMNALHHLR